MAKKKSSSQQSRDLNKALTKIEAQDMVRAKKNAAKSLPNRSKAAAQAMTKQLMDQLPKKAHKKKKK